MYREPRGARKVNPQNDGRRHSVGVKVKEWKGAWWVFVDHQGRRKAKRAGPGSRGKKLAEAAATKIAAKLLDGDTSRSEEHTSELQSRLHLVCRLLLEKKKKTKDTTTLTA